MNNNRLSQIFQELTPLELREFAKYIRSSLFNKHETLILLFDYLRKHKGKSWDERQVFRHLYPHEDFNIKKLHHANSFLLKQVENYLAWKEWTSDGVSSDLYLLKAYRKKHLDKPFNRVLRLIQNDLNKNDLRNDNYHYFQYELLKEQFLHESKRGRSTHFNLQELSDAQDHHFIANKLKTACIILSHQSLIKKNYDSGMLNEALAKIETNPKFLNLPAIALYYYAFKALSNIKDEEAFIILKQLIDQKIDLFDENERRDIYILSINYCIRRLNSGDKQFIREAFILYRKGLEKRAFIENGHLSRWTYNNIIMIGLLLEEYDWVEGFIYEYKEHLETKTREDSFSYNLAIFYYKKKEYKKTMPILIQTKFDDLHHSLGAKSMLAKMYYELSEWDALDSLLDSFKIYIFRKKDIGYHKDIYNNFISILKKLTTILPNDKEGIKSIKEEIEETKVLAEKKWLLEQINMK